MITLMSDQELDTFTRAIDLPASCRSQVLAFRRDPFFTRLCPQALPILTDLLQPTRWDQALARLKALLGEDPAGMKMLTFMLAACGETRKIYESFQISETIFLDTMKCFPRFINEHLESYGTYGFDRDFWTMRQIAARLFRLGSLEYELTEEAGQKAVHIHIPSDGDLSRDSRRASYAMARDFLKEFFPAYQNAPFLCTSWLLSPGLKECLPRTSRIRSFQEDFVITETFPERMDFLTWVYKRPDIPLEELPENTSLQRELKRYLLKGGKVGETAGVLAL